MWDVLGGLLIGTAVSGLIPLVNAELLVIGATVAAPGVGVLLVAAVSTTGQMTAKTLLYALARWAPGCLPARARRMLDRASAAVAARGDAASSLVFASATLGVPPMYGTSLAAGALGMRLRSFLVSGSLGRVIRFGTIAFAARWIGGGVLP